MQAECSRFTKMVPTMIKFEFDEKKNQMNLEKHGIGFDDDRRL
jgi:hypothetical protein